MRFLRVFLYQKLINFKFQFFTKKKALLFIILYCEINYLLECKILWINGLNIVVLLKQFKSQPYMYKIVITISLFFISVINLSQEKIEWIDVDEIILKTQEKEREREYEDAIIEISKIPINDSAYYSSLTSKSYYYIQNKQYEEAIKVCEIGLKTKEENVQYYFILNKVAALLALEEYKKGLVLIEEGLKKYPKNHSLYYSKGYCFEKLEKFEKSAEMYKTSITFHPFYAKTHLRLANLCYNEHLITQTMMCLNMYLLCSPDGPSSFDVLNYFNNIAKSRNEMEKHKGVEISKDDKSFEEIDLIINNYAALNKKYKTGNKIKIPVVKQNHAMLKQLENFEGNDGFWSTYYVPFFKWVDQNDLFDPFTYTICFSIENKKYKSIINKKITKVESFLEQFRSEWVKIIGENHEELIDNKKTKVQYVYYNSKIQGYGKVIDNITQGKWTIFNQWGGITSEGTFDEKGEKHKQWTWYNDIGNATDKGNYIHGKLTGEYLQYHPNKMVKKKSHYKDGELEGKFTEYNKHGALIEAVTYSQGLYQGDYISYYALGEGYIHYKIPYIDGEIQGKGYEYYPSGKVKTEMNFKNNEREGATVIYYLNGKVEINKNYQEGSLNGKFKEYHLNGNLYQEGNYLDDKLNGVWKTYYDDNVLASVSEYEKGKRVGEYKKYDRDGKLHFEYIYKRGNIIAYKNYDKKGEIIKEARKKGGEFFYISHAPNGNVVTEGIYDVSGGKEGEWNYYNNNGTLTTTENLKENNLDGNSTSFYSNGNIEKITPYMGNSLTGYYTSYYPNKQLKNQGWYKKGLLSGKWEIYYEDGTIKQRSYYTNGKAYGITSNYNGQGKLVSEDKYIDGDLKNITYYNPKGEVVEVINYDVNSEKHILENKFVNGNLSYSYEKRYNINHGKYISRYFGGNLYCEGEYHNGNQNGPWKWYHENGKLYKEGTYSHGNKEGIWKTYHDNGKLNEESYYLEGYQIKTEKTYNTKGVLTLTREFVIGDLHGESRFYSEEKGKLQLVRYYNYGTLTGYSYSGKDGKLLPMIPIKNETAKIKAFYDNGKPSRVLEIKDGKFINDYLEYYYSGKIQEEQTYEENKLKGMFKNYYTNGNVKSEGNYLLGTEQGDYITYYSNGKIKKITPYYNGDINGIMKFYDKNSKLIKEKEYFNNEVISEKKY